MNQDLNKVEQGRKVSKNNVIFGLLIFILLVVIGVLGFLLLNKEEEPDHTHEEEEEHSAHSDEEDDTEESTGVDSDYLGEYTLKDEDYGTMVEVTIAEDTRTIVSNALPNHETGDFPNEGNPNSIEEQSNIYSFPLNPVFKGNAVSAREPGVAINGIKFEPETAETVTCSTGESYRIEAFQDFTDLGFDLNNAHVQPDGTYHYHGVPTGLIDIVAGSQQDLVHVGFAADGFLIYYSKSDAYKSGYALANEAREGSNCSYRNQVIAIDKTTPDGTYVLDWEYSQSNGDLDECNGMEIDGEYMYLLTDSYPFIGRCLNGDYEATQSGPPTGGQMPPR